MSLSILVEDVDKFANELRAIRNWHQEQARIRRGYAGGKGLSAWYIAEETKLAEFHEAAAKTLFAFQVVD